ncbi:MAG: 30S ribosomal protein S16 [Candidatus Omnitrophota bacterium]|nr:30S ribosomal protein S16 [Candidatus Omnitrophota bacterium]
MLRIRLRKPGKVAKGRYHFKIVVIEGSKARDSRFIEQLGHYDPSRKLLKFDDIAKYESWVKKGAQPTETVASLFKKYKKQITT